MEYKIITLTRLKDFLTEAKDFFAEKVHKHTVSEITDFPSSLPANGGNSSTVNGHTVNVDVPLNAKFTDTWRGIQNNLTSDSTTDSLSAAQGKALNEKINSLDAQSNSYLNRNGNTTLNGTIVKNDTSGKNTLYIETRDNAAVSCLTSGQEYERSFNTVVGQKTSFGYWAIGNLSGFESLQFLYTTDEGYKEQNNQAFHRVDLPCADGTIITTANVGEYIGGKVTIVRW